MTRVRALDACSKWYGDSNKLVAAVWSLAQKLQPTILFIGGGEAPLSARCSDQPLACLLRHAKNRWPSQGGVSWQLYSSRHATVSCSAHEA